MCTYYIRKKVYNQKVKDCVMRRNRQEMGTGPATPEGSRGHASPLPPTFLHSKKKKGRQRQKRKRFKAEIMKRLSPRSKYYCLSHSRTFRIRKFFWSVNHGDRQHFSVFHALPPPHFQIHFAGPEVVFLKDAFPSFHSVRNILVHCKIQIKDV